MKFKDDKQKASNRRWDRYVVPQYESTARFFRKTSQGDAEKRLSELLDQLEKYKYRIQTFVSNISRKLESFEDKDVVMDYIDSVGVAAKKDLEEFRVSSFTKFLKKNKFKGLDHIFECHKNDIDRQIEEVRNSLESNGFGMR